MDAMRAAHASGDTSTTSTTRVAVGTHVLRRRILAAIEHVSDATGIDRIGDDHPFVTARTPHCRRR